MEKGSIPKIEALGSLPAVRKEDHLPEIQRRIKTSGLKVVVLDDDPTGTQTVHSIPVLTDWSAEVLQSELQNDIPAFYILTNSRSLPLEHAQAINKEIGCNLRFASLKTGHDFVVISRSDSTLRGHFPGEVDSLAHALQLEYDGWLIIPFFLEGGRYTIGDVHYVAEDDVLIPVGQTEFAKDAAFGFHASNLRLWVQERTGGRFSAQNTSSVSIEDIRVGGHKQVLRRLLDLKNSQVCIVNASSYSDLEVFVLGLLEAEEQGHRFLYRTAASFVRVRAGISPRALLEPHEMITNDSGGGLIIAGSYVQKTTSQLERLSASKLCEAIEMDVSLLLRDKSQSGEIHRIAEIVNKGLGIGKDVLIYTSRQHITGEDVKKDLQIGRRVSNSLAAVVQGIHVKPRYILAKGGITSSDIATAGLNVKRAVVLGQIIPGVPVWRLGSESLFPGIPYIVFPGNVGGPQALKEIVTSLSTKENSLAHQMH